MTKWLHFWKYKMLRVEKHDSAAAANVTRCTKSGNKNAVSCMRFTGCRYFPRASDFIEHYACVLYTGMLAIVPTGSSVIALHLINALSRQKLWKQCVLQETLQY